MEVNGVLGIILDPDKRILLTKRSDIPLWTIPGGDIEENETPKQAIIREIQEETGINIKVIKTIGYNERKDFEKRRKDNKPFVCQTYLCKSSSRTFHPNKETAEIKYWHIQKLPPILVRWHKDIILDTFKTTPSKNKKIKMSLLKELLNLLPHPFILLKIAQKLLLNKKL